MLFSHNSLDSLPAVFAGADTNAIVERQNEYFTVTVFVGAIIGTDALADRRDGRLKELLVDADKQLYPPCQGHLGFTTLVFGIQLDGAESLDVHHGQTKDGHGGQLILDGLKPGRRNNGNNQFHGTFDEKGRKAVKSDGQRVHPVRLWCAFP